MNTRRSRAALDPIAPLLVLLGLAVFWAIRSGADTATFKVIPSPDEVWAAFLRNATTLFTLHIPTTLLETLIGLAIALVAGIGIAALLDFSPLVRRAVYPILITSQTIPLIAIAPVLLLIFGFGIAPKVTIVVLFCVFPITIATLDGFAATDPASITLLVSMGASRSQIWRLARFPAALPGLFSGLRIAATYSVTGAITGEYITAQQGLGQYLRSAYSSAHVDQAFVAIGITALLSLGLVAIVASGERLLLPWYYARLRAVHWNSDEDE